MAIMPH